MNLYVQYAQTFYNLYAQMADLFTPDLKSITHSLYVRMHAIAHTFGKTAAAPATTTKNAIATM